MSRDSHAEQSEWWRPPVAFFRSAMRGIATWHNSTTTTAQIVGCGAVLVMFGLTMVLSSSMILGLNSEKHSPYGHFFDQCIFAGIGLVAAVLAAFVPVHWYRIASPYLLGLGLILQALVFTKLGDGAGGGGNRNWLLFGGFSFQPSEASKLALILWLASALAAHRDRLHRTSALIVPVGLPIVAVFGLTMMGKDLGTGLVIMLIAAGVLFVSGVPLRVFAALGIIGAVVATWGVFQSGSRMKKVTMWWNNEDDPLGLGLQVLQAQYALAGGGTFGTGVGASPEKWGYLPEPHNDFIFAVIGGELGFVGAVIVLGLYVALGIAGLKIIERHTDPFVRIATAGILTWIVGQSIFNISVVVGLLPVFGVPLPLLSSGGSALVMCMIALGVLVAFARVEPKPVVGLEDNDSTQRGKAYAKGSSGAQKRTMSGSKMTLFGKKQPKLSQPASKRGHKQPAGTSNRSPRKAKR